MASTSAQPPDAAFAVPVAGGSLAGRETGDGPPVLLVNGTSPELWARLPELLAPRQHVVAYDRRAFGDSHLPPPRDPAVSADDAAAVLRARCGEPAIVVGWSSGGVIAIELAMRFPELVAGLVLIEPSLHSAGGGPRAIRLEIAFEMALARAGMHGTSARRFLRLVLGREPYDAMPATWRERVDGADARGVAGDLFLGTGEHLELADIGAIDRPTRVLYGDRPGSDWAARRAAEAIPAAELVHVPKTGHAIQWDAPEAVVDAVAAVAERAAAVAAALDERS